MGCESTKRIEVYDDELKFKAGDAGKKQKIENVAMSSEPHRNFFLLAMDKVVYKYDLVTKELLFEFKTPCSKGIFLYDFDDKLVAADNEEIRLWDFDDHKEEAPAFVKSVYAPFMIDNIFYLQTCRTHEVGKCDDHYIVITNKAEKRFILYGNLL